MLNDLLKDEELSRIFFAEILNQNGANTGVDTESLLEKWVKENKNDDSMSGEELEIFKQNLIKNMNSNCKEDMVVLGDVLDKEEEDDNMTDVPMSIRELEEKHKNEPTERLAEPDYYAGNGLSPLEAFKKGLLSREELIGFIKGNVIKYTVRAGHKHNASEDIVKAIDYLTHLKRLYEDEMMANNDNPVVQESKRIMKEAIEGLDKIQDVRTKP